MSININDFFDKPSEGDWLLKAMSSLKLEDVDEFEKKLNFDTNEGIILKSNYPNESHELSLTSFPTERKLARFTNEVDATDIAEEVDLFIYKGAGPEEKNVRTIVDKLSQNKNDWFDLFSYLLKNSDSKESTPIDGVVLIDLALIHNSGASINQELTLLISLLDFLRTANLKNKIIVKLSVDSLFFSNIAKLRAIRYFCEFFQELFSLGEFEILSEPSIREMTVYDPWMNMLRQTSNLASAFLGGANILSVHSYDYIYKNMSKKKISDLGVRQSRNQFHILKEESFLSQVKDPARGSYTLEALSRDLISQSFDLFKHWETKGGVLDNLSEFSEEVNRIAKKRKVYLAKNKISIAGVNSFSNTEERFDFNCPESVDSLFPLRRTSEEFETLRNLVLDKKLRNILLVYGKESALSARIMYCVNYFEVLGHKIEIIFYDNKFSELQADNIIICAKDEDYDEALAKMEGQLKGQKFLAGNRYKKEGYQNIFAGQNIYEVLLKAAKGGLSE